jgi:hypothetical protein
MRFCTIWGANATARSKRTLRPNRSRQYSRQNTQGQIRAAGVSGPCLVLTAHQPHHVKVSRQLKSSSAVFALLPREPAPLSV